MRRTCTSAPVVVLSALLAAAVVACSARTEIDPAAGTSTAGEPTPPTETVPTSTSVPATAPAPAETTAPVSVATTTPSTAPAATPAPAVPAPDVICPEWSSEVVGAVPEALAELSGLAVSPTRADAVWAHNDSGDTARLFAITADGTVLTELRVGGLAFDWEDIATATAPDGRAVVWVADTGDNLGVRPSGSLVRVPEPDLADPEPRLDARGAASVRVRYAGDGSPDVEALIADPATGDLLLVTKSTGTADVHRIAAADLDDGEATTEVVAAIAVPDERFGPTGATVAADGSLIAIRTPRAALVWPSTPGRPVADVLAAQPDAPCTFALEPGEAIAASPDGSELLVASEGEGSDITSYRRVA